MCALIKIIYSMIKYVYDVCGVACIRAADSIKFQV